MPLMDHILYQDNDECDSDPFADLDEECEECHEIVHDDV